MPTKLLLADDSVTIQKVVGIIFAGEEYELAIVDNGAAALAKAREFMPDLLLVDAVMPGMTGYEVCEEVRRDSALRGVPILLLTGAFEPFDDGKAKQCGADDYISKPFESQTLIDKVSELVDLGRQRVVAAPAPALQQIEPLPPVQPETIIPAPPPPVPQFAPAAAIPAAQTAAAAAGAFAPETEPAPSAGHDFEFEMVEGTAEDDLWGAFDLEDEAAVETAAFDDTAFAVEPLTVEETVAEDLFGLVDEAGAVLPAASDPGEGFAAQWGPDSGSEFSFAEEEPPGLATPSFEQNEFVVEAPAEVPEDPAVMSTYAPPAEQEFDLQFAPGEEAVPASGAETLTAASLPSSEDNLFDLQFASGEEFMPAQESLTPFAASPAVAPPPGGEASERILAPAEEFVPPAEAPAPVPVSSAPAFAAAGSEPTLSEEQLAALVSRISRDIIEKIAWEVVPDLAEIIIKEEIRKIKEGS